MYIDLISAIEDAQPAFFFTPDISGFTKFIKSTKIEKSKEYIHQLLEVIIDSNILNFKTAEILGDAVMFYKTGDPPGLDILESQVKKTFLDFHLALLDIREKSNIEPEELSNLTIKIIVHYGCITTTEIKGMLKLVGPDVILAHRILKNNVKEKEYLLMTDQYLLTQNEDIIKNSFTWSKLRSGYKTYDYIGKVHYKFLSLSHLKEVIDSRKTLDGIAL
ncbi:hypothetical protein MYP_2052 [Sporocytophaga myxococcoides]|uniref:Guanylate cyclase domain-containing protein n=1 Tax=Sporocytophaga myxococcoides TaxID=153721 RepID=A0A098LEI3_9BACT|nr:DUF2652 domain-containing protein [Sporocytophaga myxococcoides]GAL84824.1 hypothetical protein MYP_2052 [Sporocytophaga myxococcoides]